MPKLVRALSRGFAVAALTLAGQACTSAPSADGGGFLGGHDPSGAASGGSSDGGNAGDDATGGVSSGAAGGGSSTGRAATSGIDGGSPGTASGAGSAGRSSGSGGAPSGASGSGSGTTSAGSGRGGPGTADASYGGSADAGTLDAVRQACVDEINRLRATLSLSPLQRATPAQEACSDSGAQKDATTNSPHSSAGMCTPFQGQNTCPDLPVGGALTLQASLVQCLDQMWAEGPPPAGTTTQQCIQDYQNCFLKHGHYINMTMPQYAIVSCGFYQMSSGAYWGNQDFAY